VNLILWVRVLDRDKKVRLVLMENFLEKNVGFILRKMIHKGFEGTEKLRYLQLRLVKELLG
jgi:hypothetical protein